MAIVAIHGLQNSMKSIIFDRSTAPTPPVFPNTTPVKLSGFQTQYLKIRNDTGASIDVNIFGYDTGPNWNGVSNTTDLDTFLVHYQVLSTTLNRNLTPTYSPNPNPSPVSSRLTVAAHSAVIVLILDVMDLINIQIVSVTGTWTAGEQLLASVRSLPI